MVSLSLSFSLVTAVSVIAAICSVGTYALPTGSNSNDHSEQGYLVTLKSRETFRGLINSVPCSSLAHAVGNTVGVTIRKTFCFGSFRAMSVESASREMLIKLRQNPMVEAVIPNFIVDAFQNEEEDNDEEGRDANYDDYDDEEEFPEIIEIQKGAPRHLARISRRTQLSFDLRNPEAYRWRYNYYYNKDTSGESVRAYILDSGIYKDHEDLDDRVEFGHDFTQEGPGDRNGHGTHVAGIVGSRTFGVAKNVTLIDVKCLDSKGHGSLLTVLSAVEFAVRDCQKYPKKHCVANLSLGAIKNAVINQAIAAAVRANVAVVVAAGNSNMNACWSSPASASEAITVGAFDDRIDTIAKFSNWGPCVDIFAPGVSVASLSNKPNHKFVVFSGTSMAAPSVCGVVALLLDEGIPVDQIKETLLERATGGVFQRRTLLFKPNTVNRILFNGVDGQDDGIDVQKGEGE